MRWRNRQDDDTVTVHVTPRGGLYVNEQELLSSKAAQDMMDEMAGVLDEGHHQQDAERSGTDSQGASSDP